MSLSLILVIILYSGIQILELSAVLARTAGILSNNHLLGYSVQQSIYMGTRLLLVFLMPILGLVADTGVSINDYQLMVHLSLALSAFSGFIVLITSSNIINYYCKVMTSYKDGKGFVLAFFSAINYSNQKVYFKNDFSWKNLFLDRDAKKIFIFSTIVFTVYSIGVFLAFYFALVFSDYRVAISQLSGVLNALGAVLLTFIVEPLISRRIDEKSDNSIMLVWALFFGRLFALLLISQIFVSLLFYFPTI